MSESTCPTCHSGKKSLRLGVWTPVSGGAANVECADPWHDALPVAPPPAQAKDTDICHHQLASGICGKFRSQDVHVENFALPGTYHPYYAAASPAENAQTHIGTLWLCYHALKASEWEYSGGARHLCAYCFAVESVGHDKNCMIGNALKWMAVPPSEDAPATMGGTVGLDRDSNSGTRRCCNICDNDWPCRLHPDPAAQPSENEAKPQGEIDSGVKRGLCDALNRILVHFIGKDEHVCPECNEDINPESTCDTCYVLSEAEQALKKAGTK